LRGMVEKSDARIPATKQNFSTAEIELDAAMRSGRLSLAKETGAATYIRPISDPSRNLTGRSRS
jgi:hypothetical protein